MKKILLACPVILALACSPERDSNRYDHVITADTPAKASRELPPIENPTDEMFHVYVTSPIFLEVKQLITDFNEDLRFEGSLDEIRTPDQMFAWINGHLSQTGFSSPAEAQSRWNHIKNRKAMEISSFPHIYDYIASAPQDEVRYTLHKWLIEIKSNEKPNCQANYMTCTKNATNDYAATVKMIKEDGGNNVDGNIANADRCHEEAVKVCDNLLKQCLGS